MRVAQEFDIQITYDELLTWVQENMKEYDVIDILTAKSHGFDGEGNLILRVKSK